MTRYSGPLVKSRNSRPVLMLRRSKTPPYTGRISCRAKLESVMIKCNRHNKSFPEWTLNSHRQISKRTQFPLLQFLTSVVIPNQFKKWNLLQCYHTRGDWRSSTSGPYTKCLFKKLGTITAKTSRAYVRFWRSSKCTVELISYWPVLPSNLFSKRDSYARKFRNNLEERSTQLPRWCSVLTSTWILATTNILNWSVIALISQSSHRILKGMRGSVPNKFNLSVKPGQHSQIWVKNWRK